MISNHWDAGGVSPLSVSLFNFSTRSYSARYENKIGDLTDKTTKDEARSGDALQDDEEEQKSPPDFSVTLRNFGRVPNT